MGTRYSITVKNNLKNTGDFCLYQMMPNQAPNVMSMAWYSKMIQSEAKSNIDWSMGYGEVWSERGQLSPDVRFRASEIRKADSKKEGKNAD